MKKLIVLCSAISVFAINSAFAEKLGVLNREEQPQNLKSVEELKKDVTRQPGGKAGQVSPNVGTTATPREYRGRGRGHYGGGYYNYYNPYYYYNPYSYYNPYYYYYPYYYRHHHHRRNAEVPTNTTRTGETAAATEQLTTCFAADNTGYWYGVTGNEADNAQNEVNTECATSGLSCNAMGCALNAPETEQPSS